MKIKKKWERKNKRITFKKIDWEPWAHKVVVVELILGGFFLRLFFSSIRSLDGWCWAYAGWNKLVYESVFIGSPHKLYWMKTETRQQLWLMCVRVGFSLVFALALALSLTHTHTRTHTLFHTVARWFAFSISTASQRRLNEFIFVTFCERVCVRALLSPCAKCACEFVWASCVRVCFKLRCNTTHWFDRFVISFVMFIVCGTTRILSLRRIAWLAFLHTHIQMRAVY